MNVGPIGINLFDMRHWTALISLIITTYHRGTRIATTLDSVVSQTVQPDEIIVVDDCSPDGTGAWVTEHYPQVRVIKPAVNGGTSAARNFGAQAASGQVLMFLDHDDELLPHAVETLRDLLNSHAEAKAAYADHTYINRVSGINYPDHHTAQSAFHRLRSIPCKEGTGQDQEREYGLALYDALLQGNLLQQPWAIYKDVFQLLGGFDEQIKFCEDWDFYLRVTKKHPIVLSDRVISNHIVEGENLHLDPRQSIMHQRVLEKRLRQEPWYRFRNVWLLKRRLAMYFKMSGDQLRQQSLKQAWKQYTRSFFLWPFDYVVAVRMLALPFRFSFGQE